MNFKEIIKYANNSLDKSLISYGRDIVAIAKMVVQRDVYDYYDKIRAGNYEEAYDRTYALKNNIRAFHSGKGKISIRFESHTPEILNYIRGGSNDWTHSVIYNLSPNARQRDFLKNTMDELKKRDIVKDVSSELYKYGLRIKRI